MSVCPIDRYHLSLGLRLKDLIKAQELVNCHFRNICTVYDVPEGCPYARRGHLLELDLQVVESHPAWVLGDTFLVQGFCIALAGLCQ